jgi:LysR family transcriptional regulator of beta-lactamase
MATDRPNLPLNGLRAFEVAARQGSFTQAAIELRVTQAAVSQQVLRLEDLLGVRLFTRTSSGLVLTDEGLALRPVLTRSFDEMGDVLDRFLGGRYRETLHLGVVTTFAAGWLQERLPAFEAAHPGISIRIFTNNNRIDIAREGLHVAIRFGDGQWPGLFAMPLLEAPLTPLCAPQLADSLRVPGDLGAQVLFRSYRADEWRLWFEAAGGAAPDLHGPVLDSSLAMADMAEAGLGVGLLPAVMFARRLGQGRLVRPFAAEVAVGRYWLTRPRSKAPTPAMRLLEAWLCEECAKLSAGPEAA